MSYILSKDQKHSSYSSVAEYFDFAQQPRSRSMTVGSIAKKMVILNFKLSHTSVVTLFQAFLTSGYNQQDSVSRHGMTEIFKSRWIPRSTRPHLCGSKSRGITKFFQISYKFFSFFVVLNLLVSCATTETKAVPIPSQKSFQQDKVKSKLLKLNSWKVKGVIGIIYNNKAESANYIYSQDDDKFNIKLYGPLGIGSVQIKGDPNKVTLENSKGQKAQAKDAKSLMIEQLGWYVPVDGFKYWIKATAIPNIKYKSKLNQNNLLDKLEQNNWDISYKAYQLVDFKYPLPSKIRMSRDNLIVKIVIKSWQI